MKRCCFVIPGDWRTPTGGYRYDRRIVLTMREAGLDVRHVALPDGFPIPDSAALAASRLAFEEIADGTVVVVDGLAFGVLAEVLRPHAERLRLVALVHHPLHLETGLDTATAARLKAMEREALSLARRVIVTSASTVADLQAMGVAEQRVAVVEPGVDLGPTPGRHVSGSAEVNSRALGAPVRLLCVATLVPRKGHAVLLEALGGLQDDEWTLDIVGSETRDEATALRLRALAASLGLGGRIRWHGEMDERGVEERYAESDVFVLPSFYEGYGMVVTEALAHGLPVVTTTGGALARTLPPGAGLHVPPGDVTALREALRRVINDDALRSSLADGARRAAATLPTWETAAARFAAVLNAVEAGEC